jgi:hypothetical protein
MKLTIDVIDRSIGDIELKSQSGYNEIQYAFDNSVSWEWGA